VAPNSRAQIKHIKLHNPGHLQVALQKNLTISRMPRRIEPAQFHAFNTTNDSVEDLDAFPYLGHVEDIADLETQPRPPLKWMETFIGAVAALGADLAAGYSMIMTC